MSVPSRLIPTPARFHGQSSLASLLPRNRQVGVPGGDGGRDIKVQKGLQMSRTLLAVHTLRGGWGDVYTLRGKSQVLVWG